MSIPECPLLFTSPFVHSIPECPLLFTPFCSLRMSPFVHPFVQRFALARRPKAPFGSSWPLAARRKRARPYEAIHFCNSAQGLKRSELLRLPPSATECVEDRKTVYRSHRVLERAGQVHLERHRSRGPTVSSIDLSEAGGHVTVGPSGPADSANASRRDFPSSGRRTTRTATCACARERDCVDSGFRPDLGDPTNLEQSWRERHSGGFWGRLMLSRPGRYPGA
jgi:hypothetical protein